MSKSAELIRLTKENATLQACLSSKDEVIGSLKNQVNSLETKKYEDKKDEESKEPQIKVVHYNTRYDDYNDDSWQELSGVEFINMGEVKELMKKKLDKELEDKLEEQKRLVKELRNNVDTVQDRVEVKDRQIMKLKVSHVEELADLKDKNSKREKDLQKAYDEDVKEYNDTIKDLKEEIKKIKDNKTDAEIEEKRNKEITTLKGRIKDLERILTELKNSSFFSRITKLRTINLEQNKAAQELEQKRIDASCIGTTWVKEDGKVRKYDSFAQTMNSMNNWFTVKLMNWGW
jgi:hypothetical protein